METYNCGCVCSLPQSKTQFLYCSSPISHDLHGYLEEMKACLAAWNGHVWLDQRQSKMYQTVGTQHVTKFWVKREIFDQDSFPSLSVLSNFLPLEKHFNA